MKHRTLFATAFSLHNPFVLSLGLLVQKICKPGKGHPGKVGSYGGSDNQPRGKIRWKMGVLLERTPDS